jgi:hypothetical protein
VPNTGCDPCDDLIRVIDALATVIPEHDGEGLGDFVTLSGTEV